MSNLSNLASFFALLQKIDNDPKPQHLGQAIKNDPSINSFIIPDNVTILLASIILKNRDGPINLMIYSIALDLKNDILILGLEKDTQLCIALDDLTGMKFLALKEIQMFNQTKTPIKKYWTRGKSNVRILP